MSATVDTNDDTRDGDQPADAAFARADEAFTFGPSFFLGHLGRYVRDHCPSPDEHLPNVQLRLADGQTLEVCHIAGVSPRWVMVAIRDAAHQNEMAIDIVPYHMVHGVRIRSHHADTATVGFDHGHSPAVISAEVLLQSALTRGTSATG